jgi:hypothetical protein
MLSWPKERHIGRHSVKRKLWSNSRSNNGRKKVSKRRECVCGEYVAVSTY